MAALPACLALLARPVRAAGGAVISKRFTLIAGRDGNIEKV